jgi:hypothetical protein
LPLTKIVTGVLGIFTHFQEIANLCQAEIHFLGTLNEP